MSGAYSLRTSMRDIASIEGWNSPLFLDLTMRQALPAHRQSPEVSWIDSDIAKNNFRQFMMSLMERANLTTANKALTIARIPFLIHSGGFRYHYFVAIDCPEAFPEREFKALLRDCWHQSEWGFKITFKPTGIMGWESLIRNNQNSVQFIGMIDWHNYLNIS